MINDEPIVYVIDDDPALCDATHWLLQSINLKVEIYHNGQDFLTAYAPKKSGCILLDIRMPTMGGFELLQELKIRHNLLPIIFITGHGDVPLAVRAMQEGAIDFILKPFNDQLLIEKVQKAILDSKTRQGNEVDPSLLERIANLTPREHEMMKKIAEGKLSKEIAYELQISEATVVFHRGNLMRKLQIKTVAELVKLYVLSTRK